MMQILFVEDNETFASQIMPLLREIPDVVVQHERSREAGSNAVIGRMFDLVILDLTIPPDDSSLEIASEHGQSLFHEIREFAPGTSIFILTGSEPDEFSRRLARFGENIDIWGAGNGTNTVDYFLKEEVDVLLTRVAEIAATIADTDRVELDTRGRDLDLSEKQKRILRIFARKAGGISCEIRSLSGGLSEARVLRALAKNDQGRALAICAGKLGSRAGVEEEGRAYQQHVKRLKIGAFPPVYCTIDKGVGGDAGIFYSLAEDNETLFELLTRTPSTSVSIVKEVKAILDRWADAKEVSEVEIREVRQSRLSDDELAGLAGTHGLAEFADIEDLRIRVSRSCVHGDLHAGNILVGGRGEPVIIDFGDVGPGFTCIDPVTLELSLLFHPEALRRGFSDELRRAVELWPDVDRYVERNPLGPLIEECRDWAHDVGAGDKDVLASGYAFAVRQLKYDTVPAEVTLSLLRTICSKLRQS
ncbi:phosphotransferase [Sphingomonas sp. LY160]|uniref:phosphotransferase n=1 Tax=Sphingomonas sp. LY160 TaxID=3095342 RepID=UPI002ADED5A0|nr:phosphotransferase [Sphingomonas sp. LY160]MEA1072189.1 phosphotransferase [Sphingomonas sp. LY160]